MTADTPPQTALYTLEQAIKAYRRLCQHNIAQVVPNLTVDQALTLIMLNRHPGLSQQEIAELVFKDNASLTRIVELLVKKGLLSRDINQADRRKFDLRLTVQGQQTLAGLADTIQVNQRTALRGVSADDLAQFSHTLQRIITNCTTPTLPA